MITLVGAFAGVRIFGMVGVLIGPLLLSYFFELARIDEEMALEQTLVVAQDAGRGKGDGRIMTPAETEAER